MVKWCVYLTVIILMQMTEIGCLHAAWWVCTVWAKTCTRRHTHAGVERAEWFPLNAINPLDGFNKGPENSVLSAGKKIIIRARCTCNYCALILKLWRIFMFLLGDTNGLWMRLKENTKKVTMSHVELSLKNANKARKQYLVLRICWYSRARYELTVNWWCQVAAT